ncbi:MAG: hypothetical protein N0C90_12965 [Candidatus Thiodiazotropha endolucinida]|nr:hypothetical protein [Candidatus Thiodiazotropha taylori]MCW4262272.1 hypothetical protein [Candidatus Thiodiazotropha endolucinida]
MEDTIKTYTDHELIRTFFITKRKARKAAKKALDGFNMDGEKRLSLAHTHYGFITRLIALEAEMKRRFLKP